MHLENHMLMVTKEYFHNAKYFTKSKYTALSYHFFKTTVEELEIKVVAVSTDDQLVDQFTKGLTVELFIKAKNNSWVGKDVVNGRESKH